MKTTATDYNQALYDEFWALCPDFSRYNPGAVHRRLGIRRMVEGLPFRSVLDVGCGDGQLIQWMRPWAPAETNFEGADLSAEVVKANHARLGFARFHVLDLQKHALEGRWDLILCSEVIEHLDRQADAIKNLSSMVAPGGHLVITCPTGKVHATEKHFGHVTHPTPSQLEQMLTDSGLSVVRLECWGFPFYTLLKYATNVSPQMALKNFGTTSYTPAARWVSRGLTLVNHLNLRSSRGGCQLFALARKPGGS